MKKLCSLASFPDFEPLKPTHVPLKKPHLILKPRKLSREKTQLSLIAAKVVAPFHI